MIRVCRYVQGREAEGVLEKREGGRRATVHSSGVIGAW